MKAIKHLPLLAVLLSLATSQGHAGVNIVDATSPDQGVCVDANGNLCVKAAPAVSSAANSLAPVVSAAAESNHNVKAAAAAFYDAYVTTGATAGFLLILDAASDPGNGAVTPIHCIQAPANATVGYSVDGMPAEKFSTGVELIFSTTGCFTETKSTTAFFHARAN